MPNNNKEGNKEILYVGGGQPSNIGQTIGIAALAAAVGFGIYYIVKGKNGNGNGYVTISTPAVQGYAFGADIPPDTDITITTRITGKFTAGITVYLYIYEGSNVGHGPEVPGSPYAVQIAEPGDINTVTFHHTTVLRDEERRDIHIDVVATASGEILEEKEWGDVYRVPSPTGEFELDHLNITPLIIPYGDPLTLLCDFSIINNSWVSGVPWQSRLRGTLNGGYTATATQTHAGGVGDRTNPPEPLEFKLDGDDAFMPDHDLIGQVILEARQSFETNWTPIVTRQVNITTGAAQYYGHIGDKLLEYNGGPSPIPVTVPLNERGKVYVVGWNDSDQSYRLGISWIIYKPNGDTVEYADWTDLPVQAHDSHDRFGDTSPWFDLDVPGDWDIDIALYLSPTLNLENPIMVDRYWGKLCTVQEPGGFRNLVIDSVTSPIVSGQMAIVMCHWEHKGPAIVEALIARIGQHWPFTFIDMVNPRSTTYPIQAHTNWTRVNGSVIFPSGQIILDPGVYDVKVEINGIEAIADEILVVLD